MGHGCISLGKPPDQVIRKLVHKEHSQRGKCHAGCIVAFFTSRPTYKNTVMDCVELGTACAGSGADIVLDDPPVVRAGGY
jgi:hypothetical protein